MLRSPVRPALVVMRFVTRYSSPCVPPDSQTVAVVVVLLEDETVMPLAAVQVEV